MEHRERISKNEIETERKVTKLKQDYEEKLIEFKQTYESEVAKQKNTHENEKRAIELSHVEAFANFKANSEKKFYDKLGDEYSTFQKEGDKNSKFVQELALEVMKKSPPATTRHELSYEENKGHGHR